MITITGIATDGISKGQRTENSQSDCKKIIMISATGKEIEATIEANETYRQIETIITHIATAINAQTE